MTLNISKNTLKIMKKLTESNNENEQGFLLFNKNDTIINGKSYIGLINTVHIFRKDPKYYKNLIGTFHTHPNSYTITPSHNDLNCAGTFMCLGVNNLRKIICYKKIYNNHVKTMIDKYELEKDIFIYETKNKYSYKNLDKEEYYNALYYDPNYFKKIQKLSRNVTDLFYKYEIDINTLEIKNIGY